MLLAQLVQAGQFFEAGMMICFGVSWPVDVMKLVRTRRTEGKSLAFMVLVLIGYLSGITAKLARAAGAGAWPEAVTLLYLFNIVMVGLDIALYLRFRRAAAER
jgi:hypothetical protein